MEVKTFIEYNFAPIIGLIFQLAILLFSNNFSKKEKVIFYVTLALEVLEITSYNIELYFSELSTPSVWRIIFSIAGYILRPALIYPFIVLLRPETNPKYRKLWLLDLLPFVFCVIVEQLAYSTHLVFWFSDSNTFHRGPLGYVSQIVTILYMVEAGVLMIASKVINKKVNISLVIIVMLYVVLAMVFESYYDIKSLGISAGVFSIIFFMFSLQANHTNELTDKLKELSEIDGLSKLSNRYAGEMIIDKSINERKAGIFAVLDIDKFKTINDTYGHLIGDEAIIKLSKVLKDSFSKDDIVMRLGGDEFAIYSTRFKNYEEAKDTINNLFNEIDKIRLSTDDTYRMTISMGLVIYNGEDYSTFDILYRNADTKLYKAKKTKGNFVEY